MMVKDFEIGELVWAKMKCYPYWPAKIENPPDSKSASQKKAQHYVFFFGSKNYAWISDENIVLHSEYMVNSCSKKRSADFQNAIDEIVKAAKSSSSKKKNRSLNDSKLDSGTEASTSAASTSSPSKQKNVKKVKKVDKSNPKMPRKRPSDEKRSPHISPSKVARTSDSLSLSSISPMNGEISRVAVIRPYDDAASITLSPSYIDRPSTPLLDIDTVSDTLRTKHVKPTDKRIGFLGLGMMGRGIVKNLLNSGHHVTVWNRTPEKCDDFIKAGAIRGQTPSDVVKASDIIFTCVSDPEAVKSLIFGNYGVLVGLEDCNIGEKGYVEMSSIDDETSQEIAEAIIIKGGKYLEAPITGSRQHAEEGSLMILGSGDRSLFNDCETCFHAMSKHAYYVSCDVGKSSRFSLIVSMLMGVTCGALAEAMALAERIKVSQRDLLEIIQIKGVTSSIILDKGKAMVEKNFSANTPLKHQQKDINLALALSNTYEQPMRVTTAANELYKHAKLLSYAEHDSSAVYQGAKY